jgi:hypothetical protein
MKVIDLATTKALLGITDTTYDTQITAQIPIIDAKVKQICHNNFNLMLFCKIHNGSNIVELYDIGYNNNTCKQYRHTWPTPELEQLMQDLPVGTLLDGDDIPDGSYIDEVYYNGVGNNGLVIPSFQLNENATTSSSVYIYAGINKAYQNTIAKGIWYLIGQTSTAINDTAWKSRNVGPLSITKSDMDAKLDGKSGMPAWFVKSLPRYHV